MSEDYNKHSHECMYEHHTQFVMIRVSKVLKTEAKLKIKKMTDMALNSMI